MLNYPLKTNPYTPKKWTFPTLQAAAFQRTSLQLFGLLGEISSKIFATFSPKREPLNPGSSSRAISFYVAQLFQPNKPLFSKNTLGVLFRRRGSAAEFPRISRLHPNNINKFIPQHPENFSSWLFSLRAPLPCNLKVVSGYTLHHSLHLRFSSAVDNP